MTAVRMKTDLRPLERMMSRFKKSNANRSRIRSLGGGADNPIDAMYKQWVARYSAFTRRRFAKFSRGGGNWAPLKSSTLRSRKRGGSAILRDTSILFNGLQVGAAGNETKRIRGGVQFGFGGPAQHPEGSGITIRRLAEIHQNGSKRNNIPARPIIVIPDAPTRFGMLQDLKRATIRASKR